MPSQGHSYPYCAGASKDLTVDALRRRLDAEGVAGGVVFFGNVLGVGCEILHGVSCDFYCTHFSYNTVPPRFGKCPLVHRKHDEEF